MKRKILTDYGIIEIDVQAKKIKRINIHIKSDGSVLMTYPQNSDYKRAEEFAKSKAKWIVEHQRKYASVLAEQNCKVYDSIFILGKEYTLRAYTKEEILSKQTEIKLPALRSKTSDLFFYDNTIYLLGDRTKAEAKLKKMIKEFATDYLNQRVQFVKKQLAIKKDVQVVVKNVKSWWGTCTPTTRQLKFAYRLIAFERDVIDCVIYHEFAHFKVSNHSKRFYEVLLGYCPRYYELHNKLRDSKYNLTSKFILSK